MEKVAALVTKTVRLRLMTFQSSAEVLGLVAAVMEKS
jgi:hypothetical protein